MIELIVIAICLALNGLLAAYEMAFFSFSKLEMGHAAKLGDRTADAILHRRNNPERTLSVIQIGITLVGALAAAVGGAGASESIEPYLRDVLGKESFLAEPLSILIVILPLTYLSIVIGELVPKTVALRQASAIARRGAGLLAVFDRILSPVISILEWSTKILIRYLFPISKKGTTSSDDATVELTSLSPNHQQYVLNLAHIEDREIADLMLPWRDVDSIQNSYSMEQVNAAIFRAGHTRLPVVNSNGHAMGILYTREFISLRDSGKTDWISIIRPTPRVREDDSALGALHLLQSNKSHMAMVYSDDGALLGILTLEDIMEEIVGFGDSLINREENK